MNFSINNNASAQSILSNLSNVEQQMNTSYQQLSTGNRVNSAADNPASYSISQQMTSQVNGLNQATQNAQNGISMIQTATGAMNQVEQVLQTMSTLATEAANAGNTFSDRANLQLEMNALSQQINATTNQTQYNGISLLTGQFGSGAGATNLTLQIGANQGQTLAFGINATDAGSLGVVGTQATGVNYGSQNYAIQATGSVSGIAESGAPAGIASSINASNTLLQSGMALQVVFTANISQSTATDYSLTSQMGAAAVSEVWQKYPTGLDSGTAISSTAAQTLASKISQAMVNAGGTALSTDQQNTLALAAITYSATTGGASANKAWYQALGNAAAESAGLGGNVNAQAAGTNAALINDTLTSYAANNASGSASAAMSALSTALTAQGEPALTSNQTSALTTAFNTYFGPDTTLAVPTSPTQSQQNAWDSAVSAANNAPASPVGAMTSGTIQLETTNGTTIGAAVQVTLGTKGNITIGDTATGATLSLDLNNLGSLFTVSSNVSGTYTQIDSLTTTGTSTDPNNPNYQNTSGTSANGWQASSSINGINIMTQSDAQNAVTAIQNAINNLASSQAKLGAVQNRLNYTVSNLQNSSQNLQNAQSTITNTDMAQAYTQFSQQQVLSQVGIAMLSQAQQAPGMILKLLQ